MSDFIRQNMAENTYKARPTI